MIEQLIHWDEQAFIWLQENMTTSSLDVIMPALREKLNWIPMYVLFLAVSILHFKKKAVWVILCAVLAVVLADQFSASLIKPMAMRLRPCNEPHLQAWFRHLVDCGSGYSFISSHATNHFALAIFFSWVFAAWRNAKFWPVVFLIWASSIAFAQVYVGVHYPLDVIVGALAGICIGWLMVKGCKWLIQLNQN